MAWFYLVVCIFVAVFTNVAVAQSVPGFDNSDCRNWAGWYAPSEEGNEYKSQKEIENGLFPCSLIKLTTIVSESYDGLTVDFGDITLFNMSLIFRNNDRIREVVGEKLEEITGTLTIESMPQLKRLRFPRLKSVGRVFIHNAPLTELTENWSSGKGITITSTIDTLSTPTWTNITKINIRNTGITAVAFNCAADGDEAGNIEIVENPSLKAIAVHGLAEAPMLTKITQNSPQSEVSFPDLINSSWDLEISSAETINLPNLGTAHGNITLHDNTFKKLSLPLLRFLDSGDLTISNNERLEQLDLPALERVGTFYGGGGGALRIEDNSALKSWSAPQSYTHAYDGTWLTGNFANITLNDKFPLPIRQAYSPQLHILSYNKEFNCEPFDTAITNSMWTKWVANEKRPDEVYSCVDQQPSVQVSGGVGSLPAPSIPPSPPILPSSTSASSASVSRDPTVTVTNQPINYNMTNRSLGMGGLIAVIVMSVAVFVAGVIWFVWWKKRKNARRAAAEEGSVEPVAAGAHGEESKAVVDTQQPPPYQKVDTSGQVPPAYLEITEREATSSTNANRPGV